MDEAIFLPTIVVGLLSVGLYLFTCHKKKRDVDLSILVNVFLCASGIVCGFFLMLATVVPSLKEELETLNLYIFISGMVILVVSIRSIYSEVTRE